MAGKLKKRLLASKRRRDSLLSLSPCTSNTTSTSSCIEESKNDIVSSSRKHKMTTMSDMTQNPTKRWKKCCYDPDKVTSNKGNSFQTVALNNESSPYKEVKSLDVNGFNGQQEEVNESPLLKVI